MQAAEVAVGLANMPEKIIDAASVVFLVGLILVAYSLWSTKTWPVCGTDGAGSII
jgi:uncharacterized membrane protein